METRPNLNTNISVKDFKEYYWLKSELIEFCKTEGLQRTGSKIEISESITNYLKTGVKAVRKTKSKTKCHFNWNTEKLSRQTVITENYKNSENVRAFFKNEIGPRFKFNVQFMNWMRNNQGKKLEEAIEAWQTIETNKKTSSSPKEIAPQFEYNRYIRDFMADNPKSSRESAIKLWKIKKSQRGHNLYHREDLGKLK